MSVVVGIDFGNDKCTVAVARHGRIDVLVNEESKRDNPSVVGFTDRRRLMGVAASSMALRDPANTVTQIKRLIGRRFSELEEETSVIHYKVTPGPDGFPLVNVRHLGQERSFTPTQLLGMILAQLKTLAEKSLNCPVTDCCIGVPPFFTNSQRQAVLDAAKIAGWEPIRLIHEDTAAALEYGMNKANLPEGDGQMWNVAFVDVGHASTQVSIVAFWKGNLRVLARAFDRSLGGRDLDEVLLRYFASQFKEETGKNVLDNPRACVRLRAACEKAKKILSINPATPLEVDCLLDNFDFRSEVSRAEFEKIGDQNTGRVKPLLEKAVQDAGLCVDSIDVVEVLGSGSRVPAILAVLKDFFQKEPKRTLNASECVARGCALRCAMLNPSMSLSKFVVQEHFPFDVRARLNFPSQEAKDECYREQDPIELLSCKNDPIPFTRTIKVLGTNLFLLDMIRPVGDQHERSEAIGTYEIGHGALTVDDEASFEINLVVDNNGIVSFPSAVVDIEHQTKKLKNSKKESSSKAGTPSKVSRPSPVAFITQRMLGAKSNEEIIAEENAMALQVCKPSPVAFITQRMHGAKSDEEMIAEENAMALQDRLAEETSDKKNAVEAYVYDVNKKIRREYQDFLQDHERQMVTEMLEGLSNWLYGEGDDVDKDAYVAKLEELEQVVRPIEFRYREDLHRHDAVQNLLQCIHRYRDAVTNLDPHTRKKILETCNQCEDWLNHMVNQQSKLTKSMCPLLLCSDIEEKGGVLDSICNPFITEAVLQKKSNVEAYVRHTKIKIFNVFADFVGDEEREIVVTKLKEVENWLAIQREDSPNVDYIGKLEELKQVVSPIEFRFLEDRSRKTALDNLDNSIKYYESAVQVHHHLFSRSVIDQVLEVCRKCRNWRNELYEKQQRLKPYEDPVLRVSDIESRIYNLDRIFQNIREKLPN